MLAAALAAPRTPPASSAPRKTLNGLPARVDVIVACARARHHVLDAATIEAGRATIAGSRESQTCARGGQVVIDLGMPRDVYPDVARIIGVTLIDVETVRLHASHDDLTSLDHAHAVVDNATRRSSSSERVRDLAPGLVALRRHVFALAYVEIARTRASAGPTPAIEDALRPFASVLLRQPMARSRALADGGEADAWIEGLCAVFGIDHHAGGEPDGEERRRCPGGATLRPRRPPRGIDPR